MSRKTSEQRPVFPFTSIVGQEEMCEILLTDKSKKAE